MACSAEAAPRANRTNSLGPGLLGPKRPRQSHQQWRRSNMAQGNYFMASSGPASLRLRTAD
eukprot:scaffold130064_cov33-Tisochrysis_lutea.AAC.2